MPNYIYFWKTRDFSPAPPRSCTSEKRKRWLARKTAVSFSEIKHRSHPSLIFLIFKETQNIAYLAASIIRSNGFFYEVMFSSAASQHARPTPQNLHAMFWQTLRISHLLFYLSLWKIITESWTGRRPICGKAQSERWKESICAPEREKTCRVNCLN